MYLCLLCIFPTTVPIRLVFPRRKLTLSMQYLPLVLLPSALPFIVMSEAKVPTLKSRNYPKDSNPDLVIYGHWISQPSRAVMWALLICKIPFTMVQVNPLKRETQSPEILKLNPLGKVPILVVSYCVLLYIFVCGSCWIPVVIYANFPTSFSFCTVFWTTTPGQVRLHTHWTSCDHGLWRHL